LKILGITDGQTAGAALIEDGQITWAMNEERLVRLKHARGAPRSSIAFVLQQSGVDPKDIDGVAVAEANSQFKDEIKGWRGWFEERAEVDSVHHLFFQIASRFGGVASIIPGVKSLYYAVRAPLYWNRRRRWPQVLKDEFGITAPVRFLQHHYCHATSAYFSSGFDSALVVTMDGGGDGSSSHVYEAKAGHLKQVCKIDSFDSLGNYYAYITAICGYKSKKHEGKITGLAAYGKPIYYDFLKTLICHRDGRPVNTGRVLFKKALEKIKQHLPEGWKKEDLAASIQKLSEDICRAYISHWLDKTGQTNLALAGGIFANVRINQEINDLPQVKSLFVHPGMSDEGLAAGAAYGMWAQRVVAQSGSFSNQPVISTVYLGPEYSDAEIQKSLEDESCVFEKPDNIEQSVAQLLSEGYVVARFAGRMEYGPRALGNRTILYHPTDHSVNDWLNKNLVRTEFMPFAPSTLYEEAERCFLNMKQSMDAARFMTVTFDCSPWMKEFCSGVVHLDGTARPQLVREQDNPGYYKILAEFKKLTGLPCVINTSFNMHEEPIVCNPSDAIRAFKLGHLDYLAIGSFLAKHPGKISHEIKPCRKAESELTASCNQ